MEKTNTLSGYKMIGFALVIEKNGINYMVSMQKNGFSIPLKEFDSIKNARRYICMILTF
jgi:hypothetical protein